MYKRSLDLTQIKRSFFLFGPRQVGKSFLIKQTLKPDLLINLLHQQELLRYQRQPELLAKEITALHQEKKQVVIDEIQRLPFLLNEVHALIESQPNVQFILTGSSARKLKKNGANLLGGRALTYHLHALTAQEWSADFSLENALRFGSLPSVAAETDLKEKQRQLKSYTETYLKEEIQQEALVRNVPAFSRFLELAGFENGHILNYENISKNVCVSGKTIKEYFQILSDTLVGFLLPPFGGTVRSRIVSHQKFYFFDPGIVTALKQQLSAELLPQTPPYGDAFEHWCILEIHRTLEYAEKEHRLSFYRTQDGAEVDLLIEFPQETWAIEIKASDSPTFSQLRTLKYFHKTHQVKRSICMCQTPRAYQSEHIEFLPWQQVLSELQ